MVGKDAAQMLAAPRGLQGAVDFAPLAATDVRASSGLRP